MNTDNKNEITQFDPLGIFNLNIQSELYAKNLLNGESEFSTVNEVLSTTKVNDDKENDLTYGSLIESINKTDLIQ